MKKYILDINVTFIAIIPNRKFAFGENDKQKSTLQCVKSINRKKVKIYTNMPL